MKSIILFAVVAFVAAGPVAQQPGNLPVLEQSLQYRYPVDYEQYNFQKQPYGQERNSYQVAHYIAYLFHQVQQRGYTPVQFSQYLIQHGFPESIVKYLSEQYESGLSKPYFQAPYELFHYYSSQKLSPEFERYLLQQIEHVYQQLQIFWPQYGVKSYEQEFVRIPQPISQYAISQAKYHGSSGLSYTQAQIIYQELLQVEKYTQNAMRYFVDKQVPKEMYHYIYEQLEQVLEYIPKALNVYQTYVAREQMQVPYYAAQNYIQQVNQVYHCFQNIYNFIQQQGLITKLPEYFVEQIRLAHFATQKVYQPSFEDEYENQLFGNNSQYVQREYSLRQVLQYIQLAQQYIQTKGSFSEYSFILEQLNQAYQHYNLAYQFYQRQNFVKYGYGQQQLQQAFQYLEQAYFTAQKVNQTYVVEQLRYALDFAKKLQYVEQFNYQGYQYKHEYPSFNVYEYTQNILNEFRQYVAQGVIPQQYASYIIEQFEQVLKYSYNVEYTNQFALQQVYESYQNILRYIQENQVRFPEFIVNFVNEKIQYVSQILQSFHQQPYGYHYGQYQYGQTLPQEYGPYSQEYQYKNFHYGYQPKIQSFYPGHVQQYQYAPQYRYGDYQFPSKYEQVFPSAAYVDRRG